MATYKGKLCITLPVLTPGQSSERFVQEEWNIENGTLRTSTGTVTVIINATRWSLAAVSLCITVPVQAGAGSCRGQKSALRGTARPEVQPRHRNFRAHGHGGCLSLLSHRVLDSLSRGPCT